MLIRTKKKCTLDLNFAWLLIMYSMYVFRRYSDSSRIQRYSVKYAVAGQFRVALSSSPSTRRRWTKLRARSPRIACVLCIRSPSGTTNFGSLRFNIKDGFKLDDVASCKSECWFTHAPAMCFQS